MTGNQLLTTYNEIVANDLYPVFATTSTEKLLHLNTAKREVMRLLSYPAVDVPLVSVVGVQSYSLASLSVPMFLVNSVKYNNAMIADWYVTGESIVFTIPLDGTTLELNGFQRGTPIVLDNNAISDVPEDLHLPIVYLAIVASCGSQEDDQTQLIRLQKMEMIAKDRIQKYQQIQLRQEFPF